MSRDDETRRVEEGKRVVKHQNLQDNHPKDAQNNQRRAIQMSRERSKPESRRQRNNRREYLCRFRIRSRGVAAGTGDGRMYIASGVAISTR